MYFFKNKNQLIKERERERERERLYTRVVGRPVRIWINTLWVQGHVPPEKKDKNGAIWCILSVPKYVIMSLKSTILRITRGPLVPWSLT